MTPSKQGLPIRLWQVITGAAAQIRRDGIIILPRKLAQWTVILLGIIVLLLVRLIKPIKMIRFGVLPSIRIGHFAAEPELYLCMREAGLLPQHTLDLFWYSGSISSPQLKKMWSRTLKTNPFFGVVYRVNRQIFHFHEHNIPRLEAQDRDLHGLFTATAPHLHFTPRETQTGREALRRMGVPDGAPYICFHSRDNGYSAVGMSGEQKRMYGCRNSDVQTYVPAAEWLAEQGYFCLRMGVTVEKSLGTQHPKIIDYANTARSDFMDIYLSAGCQFFIGDTSGLAEVPTIFRRSVAWVNFFALEYAPTWGKQDIFIPNKLWKADEKRFLTFREILESGIGRLRHCHEYDELGIQVVSNTADEILALAVEMEGRLKGTWQPAEEDEELQARFWSLYKPSDINGVFLCRIGAAFLRENRALLGS